jgi:predicted protein tyrosine phosphatase
LAPLRLNFNPFLLLKKNRAPLHESSIATPIHHSYWVVPERFLAGQYPGTVWVDKTHAKLNRMLQAGLDEFIDLTEQGELSPYDSILRKEANGLGVRVDYFRYPIRNLSVPEKEDMRAILDHIDQSMENGRNIYLHCWGGIGRTGTVVGCYLVRHGATGKQALERIRDLRLPLHGGWRKSPETDSQWNMVRGWQVGE